MATKTARIGQHNIEYDDNDVYSDTSETLVAIRGEKIQLDSQSTEAKHAVRYDQVSGLIALPPTKGPVLFAEVSDIMLPVLTSVRGQFTGQILIVYQVPENAEWNRYSVYVYDKDVANPPALGTDRFITKGKDHTDGEDPAGTTGFWIAVGGNFIVAKSATIMDSVVVNDDRTGTGHFTVENATGAPETNLLYCNVATNRVFVNGVDLEGGLSAQTLALASTQIDPQKGSPIRLTASGVYTLTAAPVIAAGTDGQSITLMNVGTNAITLQNVTNDADGMLRLAGATDIALGQWDTISLNFVGSEGKWVETSRSNN